MGCGALSGPMSVLSPCWLSSLALVFVKYEVRAKNLSPTISDVTSTLSVSQSRMLQSRINRSIN